MLDLHEAQELSLINSALEAGNFLVLGAELCLVAGSGNPLSQKWGSIS